MVKLLKDKLQKWVSKVGEGGKIVNTPKETDRSKKIDNKKKIREEKKTKRKFNKKEKNEKKKSKNPENIKEKSGKKKPVRRSLSEEKFDELFEELSLILLQNNVAYSAIEGIGKSLKEKLVGKDKKVSIEDALRDSIKELLIDSPDLIKQIKEKRSSEKDKPFVILFAGINGAGKTTTLAKVANILKKNKFSMCVAACDTFRAASMEQLKVHTDKLGVELIKKDYGADPASVGYDAINYAKKNNLDVVLIDTAGRMNNRDSLMKEIEKICRVNKPDLKLFLGESITGNDATTQAKDFNDAINLDGIILSKADVDEKGGTAISVSKVTGKPIYYLGTGQRYDDLEKFDKNKLIEKMFE